MPKMRISDLIAQKGKRKIVLSCAFDRYIAQAASDAQVDILLTWGAQQPANIAMEAPNCLIGSGIDKKDAYSSPEKAVDAALRLMDLGIDIIYASGMPILHWEALASRKIPCVAHVGYLPVLDTWIGGPRAVGKTVDEALEVYKQVKMLDDFGCIGVEMELVPAQVAKKITNDVKLLTFSMGSGLDCDGQFLFDCDLLGTNTGHIPRHAKKYANLYDEYVCVFKKYRDDVLTGTYPEKDNMIIMPDEVYDEFLSLV